MPCRYKYFCLIWFFEDICPTQRWECVKVWMMTKSTLETTSGPEGRRGAEQKNFSQKVPGQLGTGEWVSLGL